MALLRGAGFWTWGCRLPGGLVGKGHGMKVELQRNLNVLGTGICRQVIQ